MLLPAPDAGLKFVALLLDSIIMAGFVDASTGTNPALSSHFRLLIALMDKEYNASIIHYGSTKEKRTTKSALATKLFEMIQGFDIASTIRVALNRMCNKVNPLQVYT